MDIGPISLKHMGDELVVPEQEDFGPDVLGHKVDTLFALGHRNFVAATLYQKYFEPVDLGQLGFCT